MEKEYWFGCDACDTEVQVLVLEEQEIPQYCPMGGSTGTYEELED